MSANPNYVSLAVSTMEKVMGSVVDQTLREYPVTAAIINRGNLRKQSSATGTKITLPIMEGVHKTFEWTDRAGTANLAEAPTDHRPEWEWRYASIGYTLKKWDLTHNAGKERVMDILMIAKDKMRYEFQEGLENGITSAGGVPTDYTGAQGMPQIDGLQAAISTTNPAAGNYGNIDRTENAWWRSQFVNTNTTLALNGFQGLINTYYTIGGSTLADAPDMILVPLNYYAYIVDNKLFSKFTYPGGRESDVKNLPDGGIAFMKAMIYPIMTGPFQENGAWDNEAVFLNTKDWYLVQDADGLKIDTIEVYPGKNIMSQQGWWCGNLICTRPRAQGIASFTAVA